jgi:hypothetical protein
MNRRETLDAAAKCVLGDRDKSYGGPESSFCLIAEFWNAYLVGAAGGKPQIKPADVAAMLALLKIARLSANPSHVDSWVDLAGYAACGAEVSHGEGEG